MIINSYRKLTIAATIVAMAAIMGTPASADIPEEVKVGSLLPQSGGYSATGEQVDVATALAVDDFNAYLEEMGAGWQFVLTREDSASNPLVSLEKIQAMHADGTNIVFGPAGSERVTKVKGYVDSNNMLVLSCCSTAPSLSIPDDRIFRIVADDFNQGKALGKLLQHNGIEAIVNIQIGDTYGDGLIEATVNDFTARGGVASENKIRYNPDASEYSVSVSALADEVQKYVDMYGADKVGVVAVSFAEIVPILQSASNYPVLNDVRWFGSETVVAQAGSIAGDRIARAVANEVDLVAVQLKLDTGEKAKQVKKVLSDMFENVDAFGYTGYDAVWLAGLSILKANSADPADIVEVLPDVAADYTGALSSTQLNENGDLATADYEIYEIDGLNWTVDDTYYISTDTIAGPVSGNVFVGSLLPLTGGYSSVGYQVNIATAIAVGDFNKRLQDKNAGWQFVLLQENTESNPVVALEKAQTLHSHGADILFGPAGSERVSNVKGYVDSNNMVVLSCCSTAPALSIPDDRVFRIVADDLNQGKAMGKILEENGIEVMVPIGIGDTYGDGLRDSAANDFGLRGGMSTEAIRYSPDVPEYSLSVNLLAETVQEYVDEYGADKVAVVIVAFDEIVSILQAANNYPVLKEVLWLGSETIAQSTAVVGDEIATEFVSETEFLTVQLELSTGDKADYLKELFMETIGTEPNAFVYTGYDAVMLAGHAIEKSGSTDPADIAAILPKVAASYTGALSSTQLNENGDLATVDYDIWHVMDGSWVNESIYIISDDEIRPK